MVTHRCSAQILVSSAQIYFSVHKYWFPVHGLLFIFNTQIYFTVCWYGLTGLHDSGFLSFVIILLLRLCLSERPFLCDIMGTSLKIWFSNGFCCVRYGFLVKLSFKFQTTRWYCVTVLTKFHDMSTVTFPWQHNGLQALCIQRGKSEFSSFKKCYLLLLFIQ